jgi:hypothetical protein
MRTKQLHARRSAGAGERKEINMTYKELYESAIDKLEKSKITLGEFEKMIEPLNAEIDTDSDTISRQAAIDLIESIETERLKGNIELIYAPAIKGLRALPPAQPERIKGHWIEHDDCLTACECSVCHEKYALYEEDVFGRNYCPNCGANMRGEQDEH